MKDYELIENRCEDDNEKLKKLLNKNVNIYFNDFLKNELRNNRFTKLITDINERLTTIMSIITTLKNEDIRTRAEYDMVKNTTNINRKDALIDKLKQLQLQIDKYLKQEKEIKKELSEANVHLLSTSENIAEGTFLYIENQNHIKILSKTVFDQTTILDNMFSTDITECFIKYNLVISEFINFEKLNEMFDTVINKLIKILNLHEISFKIDTLKTVFLNCNYLEHCVRNGVEYVGAKGSDIYNSKTIKPSLHIKHKSFKILKLFLEKIESYEEYYNTLSALEQSIISNPSKIKEPKVYLGLIANYFKIAQLLYDFMYGYNIILSDYVIEGGLYERGGISYNPHFSRLSSFISNWYNNVSRNIINVKSAYWLVMNTLYGIVAIKSFSKLNITNFPANGIEELIKNYGNNFIPIEIKFNDKYIIHNRINKRAKLKKKK